MINITRNNTICWCWAVSHHRIDLALRQVLGCTPQAYKPCTCPASRLKKKPRVSNRDINSLMDWGAYTSEARSWSDTPLCVAEGRQDLAAVLAPQGEGRLPFIGGIDVRLVHQLPGKPEEEPTPHLPFEKLSWWRRSDLKLE